MSTMDSARYIAMDADEDPEVAALTTQLAGMGLSPTNRRLAFDH